MATTLVVSPLRVSVGWNFTSTTTFGTPTSNSASFTWSKTFTDGTGANAANKMFAYTYTITSSGTQSIDLNAAAGTPIVDVFGSNITFTKVKTIYVENTSSTSTTIVAVGGNTNGFVNWVADKTDKVRIRPGGIFFLSATDATAYAVTAGTGDILDITNEDGSNSATVNVFLCGE